MNKSKTSSRKAQIACHETTFANVAKLLLPPNPMFGKNSCGPSSSKPTGDKLYPNWNPSCQKDNNVRNVLPALMIREAYEAAQVRTQGLANLINAVYEAPSGVPAVRTASKGERKKTKEEEKNKEKEKTKTNKDKELTVMLKGLLGAEALLQFAKSFLTETELETLKTDVWTNNIAKNGQTNQVKLEQLSEIISLASNMANKQAESEDMPVTNLIQTILEIEKIKELLTPGQIAPIADKDQAMLTPAYIEIRGPLRLQKLKEKIAKPAELKDTTSPSLSGAAGSEEQRSSSIWNPFKRLFKFISEKPSGTTSDENVTKMLEDITPPPWTNSFFDPEIAELVVAGAMMGTTFGIPATATLTLVPALGALLANAFVQVGTGGFRGMIGS